MMIPIHRANAGFVIWALALLSLGLCFRATVALSSGKPQDANWINLEGEQPFVMRTDKETVVLPLIVSMAGDIASSQVALRLLGVRYEKLLSEEITNAFKVAERIVESAERGPVIRVTVDLHTGLDPGTYELIIEATHAGMQAHMLTVAIERPGVSFEPSSRVTIEQVYALPGGSDLHYPKQLQVSQTPESLFAQAKSLVFIPTGYKRSDGTPGPGRIEIDRTNTPIAPGEPLLADVTPYDFPIGTSTGVIEIRGPDLKTPVKVELEIRARRSPAWIFLLIVPGLLAGWFMRVYLQGRVELAQAKLDGFTVLEQFNQALMNRKDHQFNTTVEEIKVKLVAAIAGRDREKIVTTVNEAKTGFEQATKTLKEDFDQADHELSALEDIVGRDYRLPPSIDALLEDNRHSIIKGRKVLQDHFDPGTAKTTAANLKRNLPVRLSQEIALWRADVESMADHLAGLKFILTDETADLLDQRLAHINEQAGGVEPPTNLEQTQAALDGIHTLQINLAAPLRWLGAQVEQGADAYGRLLAKRGLDDASGIKALNDQAAVMKRQLEEFGIGSDPAAPPYTDTNCMDLKNSYRQLLEKTIASIQTVDDAERQALYDQIRQEKYVDAANTIPEKRTMLSATGKRPLTAEEPLPGWIEKTSRPVKTKAHVELVVESPLSVAALQTQTTWQLAAAKFWQTVIAGSGITILGYLLYADKFVGTPAEMAAIFFWGFGLDVTVDKLVELSGRVPGS